MICLTVPNFNLRQTMLSYQDPLCRCEHGFEADGYIFFKGKFCVKVEQQKKDRILFSCSEQEFFDTWFDYFDLSYDYASASDAHKHVRGMVDARIAFNEFDGVHVLRQLAWDVILKQLLSQKLNPAAAVKRIDAVFSCCNDKRKRKPLRGYKPIEWWPIPSPEELVGSMSRLDQACDQATISLIEHLSEWLPGHRLLLASPEAYSLEYVRNELSLLPLTEQSINRVLAYGFHFDEVSCIPKQWQDACIEANGVPVEDMLEYELGKAFDKPSYSGTMLAAMTRKKVMKGKGMRWG